MEHLPGLVLLRSAMMIHRQNLPAAFARTEAKVNGGLAAIAADFQHRPERGGFPRAFIQRLAFGLRQKTLNGAYVQR